MKFTVLDIFIWQICSFVIITAIIIAVRLFLKKQSNSISNYLIGFIVILSALTIFNNLLAFTGVRDQLPLILFAPLDFSFYIGPLMFLYFRHKVEPKSIFNNVDFIHFTVPLSITVLYLFYFLKPLKQKADILTSDSFEDYFNIETILLVFSLIFYTYLCSRLLKSYKSLKS